MKSFSKSSIAAVRRPRIAVYSQGSLDGMCGPYAIANALQLCGVGQADKIIQAACAAVSRGRWPDIYWRGTSMRDLQRMLLVCRFTLGIEKVVKAEYPFGSRPARTAKQFWRRFDLAFEDPTTVCAIIGIISPFHHWLVVRKQGQRVVFVDSAPSSTIYRKNRAALGVGRDSRKLASAWVLDSQDFIVIRAAPLKAMRAGASYAWRHQQTISRKNVSVGLSNSQPDPNRVKRMMSELAS